MKCHGLCSVGAFILVMNWTIVVLIFSPLKWVYNAWYASSPKVGLRSVVMSRIMWLAFHGQQAAAY
jgi:hypothetical protein